MVTEILRAGRTGIKLLCFTDMSLMGRITEQMIKGQFNMPKLRAIRYRQAGPNFRIASVLKMYVNLFDGMCNTPIMIKESRIVYVPKLSVISTHNLIQYLYSPRVF